MAVSLEQTSYRIEASLADVVRHAPSFWRSRQAQEVFDQMGRRYNVTIDPGPIAFDGTGQMCTRVSVKPMRLPGTLTLENTARLTDEDGATCATVETVVSGWGAGTAIRLLGSRAGSVQREMQAQFATALVDYIERQKELGREVS